MTTATYTWDFLFDADDNSGLRNCYSMEDLEKKAQEIKNEPEPTVANYFIGGGYAARHYPELLEENRKYLSDFYKPEEWSEKDTDLDWTRDAYDLSL
jgi:hypothetical protein